MTTNKASADTGPLPDTLRQAIGRVAQTCDLAVIAAEDQGKRPRAKRITSALDYYLHRTEGELRAAIDALEGAES